MVLGEREQLEEKNSTGLSFQKSQTNRINLEVLNQRG